MNTPDEPLNHALNALRDYLQGNLRDLADLRETSHSSGQRLAQLSADMERLGQEVQGVQQNAAHLDALRQEFLTTLREADQRQDQQQDQLAHGEETQ